MSFDMWTPVWLLQNLECICEASKWVPIVQIFQCNWYHIIRCIAIQYFIISIQKVLGPFSYNTSESRVNVLTEVFKSSFSSL